MAEILEQELEAGKNRGGKSSDGALPVGLAGDIKLQMILESYGLSITDFCLNCDNVCPPYIKRAHELSDEFIERIQRILSNKRSTLHKRASLIFWAMVFHIFHSVDKKVYRNRQFEPLTLKIFGEYVEGLRYRTFYDNALYGNGWGCSPNAIRASEFSDKVKNELIKEYNRLKDNL